MSNIILSSFVQLLSQGPTILVYIIGLVLAVVMRPQAPVAFTLAMCGFLLLLVIGLAHPFAVQYIILSNDGSSSVRLGQVFAVVGFITSVLHAAGLGLLTAGLFTQRR
jgi:hypothetical protein